MKPQRLQLRGSLRWSLFGSLLFLAASMTIVFSSMSAHNFIEGLDTMNKKLMYQAANEVDLTHQSIGEILGYRVAKRWQDLPENVQNNLPEPACDGDFVKNIDGGGFFQRPNAVYLAVILVNKSGEKRYVARVIKPADMQTSPREFSRFMYIIMFAVIAIVLFAVFIFLIIRSVGKPVQNLGDWAKSLDAGTLKNDVPEFRYYELNMLAELIRESLLSVQETLEREQAFVRHASHELRTPIASILSNTELLEKMLDKNAAALPAPQREREVAGRIHRAVTTMQHLTETLLWLSRDDNNLPTATSFSIDELLQQLTAELTYLLANKPVEVSISTDACELTLPYAASRIVLSNIIRNAFQHTDSGRVTIVQNRENIEIINHIDSMDDDAQVHLVNERGAKVDLGFGLGLKLTEQVTHRLGWRYRNTAIENGRRVSIVLRSPTQPSGEHG
ncbi:Sensor-type histidine kinase PrrB [BD1-7 clade bacterium]|uniref:histidine kinase n=1 Tax=BD1-7 clade bacterium TaxID=2029982 RepID=A0A5S9NX57_9GAMM|nr:Sensor-type histidine kinase PrrB [BD1-7 clade bacterium]CAA0096013.1 Sensor-type histidine kinase PrrB [BD1-7 clade bacterium]